MLLEDLSVSRICYSLMIVMYRGGLSNLYFLIFLSKVESDTPFLGRLWTDMAKTLVDFYPRVWSKVQISVIN